MTTSLIPAPLVFGTPVQPRAGVLPPPGRQRRGWRVICGAGGTGQPTAGPPPTPHCTARGPEDQGGGGAGVVGGPVGGRGGQGRAHRGRRGAGAGRNRMGRGGGRGLWWRPTQRCAAERLVERRLVRAIRSGLSQGFQGWEGGGPSTPHITGVGAFPRWLCTSSQSTHTNTKAAW